MATATGSFAVNHSQVNGKAALFDGAVVETAGASSRLELSNGARLEVGVNSRVQVFGSEAMLEQGSGEIGSGAGYRMIARTLRIQTGDPKSIAQVRLDGVKKVIVAAINGPVQVLNSNNVLVARMNTGMALSFDPAAASPDTFEGCLLSKGGAFGLATTDQLTELQGAVDNKLVGNRVSVKGIASGSAPKWPGATNVVTVSNISMTSQGGCVALASKWSADGIKTSAPGPGGVGRSVQANHTTAIVAGVAIAGVAGGVGAWAATKGSSTSTSR
jgi:hypothetical protein